MTVLEREDSLQTLGLENIEDDSSEVTYATWKENKLIKKTVAIDAFMINLENDHESNNTQISEEVATTTLCRNEETCRQ